MTAQELVISILEYHCKTTLAKYHASPSAGMAALGDRDYKDLETFIKYLNGEAKNGTYETGHYNIRISAKQAQWLSSLLRSYPGNKLEYRGLIIYPTNPKYPCNAGGGLVGIRADTSQWILKIKRAY
jgi:hypothetical protein